jgi:hypothetical protein
MGAATKSTAFSSLTDEEWLNTLILSIDREVDGLPGFPSPEIQSTFVGLHGKDAIKVIFPFYILARSTVHLTPESKILDFGVGWGRVLRMWLRDVPPSGLSGVDVDLAILEEARSIGVPGNLCQIDPLGEIPFGEGVFDLITAASVFSHLSEASAKHWLPRLMRALKPDGALVLTTTGTHFLNTCVACFEKGDACTPFEKILARLFTDPYSARSDYQEGRIAYAAVGGASAVLRTSDYGWSAMPKQFVEREVGELAASIEFQDSASLDQQPSFVIRRN